MLEIITLKNPFDKTRRDIERVIFVPGQVLTDYVPDQEVEFILNGNFVEVPNLTFPSDGDQIIVMPHVGSGAIKSIISTVASMYLMGIAGKIIGGTAGGIFSGLGKGTLASYLAAGAVMYVGGRIINAIVPTQQPNTLTSESTSQTYGWDSPQPITGEGGIIGITYGECIPAPQVLERHVETVNGKQYLNLLLCGGMGPVDSISDIKIGSTPIGNFNDVQIETRLGTNDQEPISFFTDTPLDQAVGVQLSSSGFVQTSDSVGAVSLEVTIEFPSGLYHMNDDGSLGSDAVTIRLEYRPYGTSSWQLWKNWSITASQNTAVRKSTRITGLEPGKYDVKATVVSQHTGSRYCNACTWSVLTSYNPGKYSRPNKVLVGVRILATNQLSGSIPDITWRQVRNTVYVWNPDTAQYETRSARNPIWAAYDIYHQCRYLKNINTGQYEYVVFGVEHDRLDPHWDEWVEAAAYSDDQVTGIDGILENRFEFDAFYDTSKKRYDAAQLAANVGHAVIMPRGNNIGIKCDKPGQMVQIFGEGRTTTSSVSGTFSAVNDRALAVEVIFSDTNNGFKNTQFLVRSPKWNTSPEMQDNPAQLQLFGVKRKSQAQREGSYTLANNELVTQFIDIGTDIDALVCGYGDIVGYSHPVSQIGIASGRIIRATTNTIQLDKTISLSANTEYQIILQLSDDTIVTKNIVAVATDIDTDVLTISIPFTTLPQQFDNYIFGESGKVVKPFRLVGVEKDGDLRCKLNLAEYVEGVYSGDFNYSIIDYTPPGSRIFDITDLSLAEENYRSKDGTNISLLHLSWNLDRGYSVDEFLIYYSEDSNNWNLWGSTENTVETITNIAPLRTYYVKVCTINGGVQSQGVSSSIYITGKDVPPSDVMSIEAIIDPSDTTKIQLSWPEVTDIDLRGYKIMEGSTVLTPTPIADTRYTYTATSSRQHIFSIVAVDNGNGISANCATTTITTKIEPDSVANFTVSQLETDKSKVVGSFSANTENDISHYVVKVGSSWGTGTIIESKLKALSFSYTLQAAGVVNFMVKAVNRVGNESIVESVANKGFVLKPTAPTNATLTQDPNNKSNIIITYKNPSDKDFVLTEVRLGNSWATGEVIARTKEEKCNYVCKASGLVKIMVCSQNISLNYSDIVYLQLEVKTEPGDVTGLAVNQLDSDRSILRFTCNASTELDFKNYILKVGNSWADGTIINNNILSMPLDWKTSTEGNFTFWIKAKNVAGVESLNAASISKQITLKPSTPATGRIFQDSTDRTYLVISWDSVSGSDISKYIVSNETGELSRITDTTYRYKISASGTYNFAIRALTTAGFISNALNLSITASVEPTDITGFTAVQNIYDHSKLTLLWDTIQILDFAYCKIKKGANWESAVTIAPRVTGTSYDVKITDESEQKFWIKAYSIAGIESKYPALVDGIYNLNPSTPTNLTVVQNTDDRSVLTISWPAIPELDILEYIVKWGTSWETGTTIITTKETSTTFKPPASGDYKIMIKARNNSDFYSDEVFTHYYSTLEPSNVTGFQSLQNGDSVELYWNVSPDADVVSYRVVEGANYENGRLVAEGITLTNLEVLVDTERTYFFHIKALNRSGKCSLIAATTYLTVANLPPKNVILNYDEVALKTGTFTNTEFGTSLINANNFGGRASDYPNVKASEIGGQTVLKLKSKELMSQVFKANTDSFYTNSGAGTMSTGSTDKLFTDGGKTIKCVNYCYVKSPSINIDPSKPLYVGVDVFQETAGTSYLYMGIECYTSAGVATEGNGGCNVYQVNSIIVPVGQWKRYEGSRLTFPEGTTKIKLRLLVNYNNTAGQTTYIGGLNVRVGDNIWTDVYYPTGEYLCATKDVGQVITANISTLFYATNAYALGGNAKLQYRTSRDGSNWTTWADFKPALCTFRYIDFKVIFVTVNNQVTPEVNTLKVNIDVPDTNKQGTATIPIGGTTISYDNTFWTEPAVIAHAVGVGLHTEIQTKDTCSFTVKVLDSTGTDVGGKISWQAIGY